MRVASASARTAKYAEYSMCRIFIQSVCGTDRPPGRRVHCQVNKYRYTSECTRFDVGGSGVFDFFYCHHIVVAANRQLERGHTWRRLKSERQCGWPVKRRKKT